MATTSTIFFTTFFSTLFVLLIAIYLISIFEDSISSKLEDSIITRAIENNQINKKHPKKYDH